MALLLMPSSNLSIITVCFNEVAGIGRTAESIITQHCQAFEWIVIDGGSTDGTLEILNDYRHRMTYFSSGQDHGIYHAMNIGASKAQGEYLLFLNGGDSLYNADVLEKCAEFFGQADVLHGGIEVVHPDGRFDKIKQFSDSDITHRMMVYRSLPHQGLYMKRDLFEKLGGYNLEYKIIADRDLICRGYLRGAKYKSIPLLVSRFVLGGISTTQIDKLNREQEILKRKYCFKWWLIDNFRSHFHSLVIGTKAYIGIK